MSSNAVFKVVHEKDAGEVLKANAGDLSGYALHGPRVLVAVYERPDKMKLGGQDFYLPDIGSRSEDQFQGKVCLVLKKGPLAFVDDSVNVFHGDDVKEGDWIAIRPNDGWSIKIGNQLCRIVEDRHIQITVPGPDAAF